MIKVSGMVLSVLLMLTATTVKATPSEDQYKEQVLEALSQFENTKREEWAFTVSRYEDEEGDVSSSIEVHQPHIEAAKRWRLVEQNGETPTKKQQDKFVKRKLKQASNKDKGQSFTLRLRGLIREETLALSSETETQFTMTFNVSIKRLGEDAEEKLIGSLIYDKDKQYIEGIEIVNHEAFSPMFMVSISTFNLTLDFQKIGQAIVPKENRMRMKGKMSFLTEIDERSVDTFTDYQYVGSVSP